MVKHLIAQPQTRIEAVCALDRSSDGLRRGGAIARAYRQQGENQGWVAEEEIRANERRIETILSLG